VKVTCSAQLAPAATLVFTQLSVSVKAPLIATEIPDNATLPEFVSVTVCVGLPVPIAWVGNVSDAGLTEAVVSIPALANGICQIPRP
jgi:hypothetical protein